MLKGSDWEPPEQEASPLPAHLTQGTKGLLSIVWLAQCFSAVADGSSVVDSGAVEMRGGLVLCCFEGLWFMEEAVLTTLAVSVYCQSSCLC